MADSREQLKQARAGIRGTRSEPEEAQSFLRGATPTEDIFSAVKHGDLERIRYLVEERGVPVHSFDLWDATPLYYASFCGHEKIITYLFQHGARCEQRTFDGERCLYAALNDNVRQLLLLEGFQHAGARGHDLYLEMLEKLYNDTAAFPDIIFTFQSGGVCAHRFMLHARLPRIGSCFEVGWRHGHIELADESPRHDAVQALLRWSYTGRLVVPAHACDACAAMRFDDALADAVAQAAADNTTSPVIVLEAPREDIRRQMQSVLGHLVTQACSNAIEQRPQPDLHCDLWLRLGDSHSFGCHRALLCARSEYFAAMLHGSFAEGQAAEATQVTLEDIDPSVLSTALEWLYTDHIDPDTPFEFLVQTMRLGDRLLMEGLKQKCAILIHPHVNYDTVLALLQEAVTMDTPRLVDTCLRCLAVHLVSLGDDERLAKLISASAETVAAREAVDTVPLVDDLRFHISQLHPVASDDEGDLLDEDGNLTFPDIPFEDLPEREQKLAVLEKLLAQLSIEA